MNIEGVYTPIVTPLHGDESVDEAAFAAAVEVQIESGVAGIVVGGTTGEYYAMTLEERKRQLAFGAEVVAGRAQLVAGCNSGATRDIIDLARHAKGLGYDANMLSAPPTSLPSQPQLSAHIRACALDGGLPVVLYNYPARAGVEFGFECLDALADMPEIIAIKESSGDFSRFLAMRDRYAGRIEIMCGTDDQAFDYLAWGVRSWLAGPANVFPGESVQFVASMLRGDIKAGRAQLAALLPFIQHLETGNYNAKVKAGMNHRGVTAGTVRRPMTALTSDEAAQLGVMVDANLAAFAAASKLSVGAGG